MSSTKRSVHKGGLFAFSALLLIAALAFMNAPVSSEAAGGTHWSEVGRDTFASLNKQLSPLVPPLFGPNVRANSDTTNLGQHEPSLAVSRVNTNTVVVAAKDYRNGNVKQVWIDVSTDGGANWPVERQLQIPGIPADLPIQSDPVVMARDDGRIYVAALGTNNSQNRGGVFITWTDDDGATWRSPSVAVYYPKNALDDKEWFAIDNNPASPYYHRMYMMYAPGAGYVVEQHSTDGGETWSTRQTLGASGTEYTYPVVASDGTVYNFMMLNWGPNRVGTVQMTKSTNGGATWTTPSTVATAQQPNSPIRVGDQFRFFAILSAAVDPNTGALYVAWTDNGNFGTNGTDVVYVKSTNGGATWGPITRLSHDPTGVVRDHITPMIIVGADSKVHAFWLDRRLDPGNHLFHSWYSSSTDGGATWDPDTQVSTEPQDLNFGFPPGSGNAAGDYWGLDTWQDTVYVAWNDTRLNNQQDILVSKGLMQGSIQPTPSPTLTVIPPTFTATVAPPTLTSTALPLTVTPTNSPSINTPSATLAASATATSTIVPLQCVPRWVLGPSITPGSVRNMLEDVDSISPNNVWAVGSYSSEQSFYDGRRTLVQHWDGTQWSTVPSPNTTADGNILHAVHAISANDIWAVGEYDSVPDPNLSHTRTLTMHWDGSSWSIVPSPNFGTPQWGTLHDVSATSANDVWAVGHSFGDPSAPAVMHWDGDQWSIVSAPRGTSESCYLYGIDAITPSDAWAVGYCENTGTPRFQTLILHWDGIQWNLVPSPSPGLGLNRANLFDVEAVSATDIWAVGVYEEPGGVEPLTYRTLVVHWDGSTWTQVPSPNVASAGNELNGISVVTANDIWAVGAHYQSLVDGQPLTMHWNGSTWNIVSSLDTGPHYNSLFGVSAISTQDVWAVGIAGAQGGFEGSRTLIEHYSIDQFGDVPPSNTFYAQVQCLACRGIVSGYADGTFRPNNPVTRGQLAKIVSNSAGFTEAVSGQTFQDVPPAHTFYEFIERLTNRGYMTGYVCGGPGEPCVNNRPYFRPFANATRGQTAKIVSNAAGFTEPPVGQTFEDTPSTHTFYEFIQRLATRNVMQGYPCGGPGEPCITGRPYFRPQNDVTRGQSAKILANTFFPNCQVR